MTLPPTAADEALRHADEVSAAPEAVKIHGRSPMQIAFERLRHDWVAVISSVIVLFFIVIALFAPLIANAFGVEEGIVENPSDVLELDTGYGLEGPPNHGFTWDHPLGVAPSTGKDNLAEWLFGARTSLEVAFVSAIGATSLGIVFGLLAGFSRGWLDRIISFFLDLFLSFPFILGALSLAPILINRFGSDAAKLDQAQFYSLILILVFFSWMYLARLIRGEVLSLREREFIQAARVIGVPTRRILFKELLPNMIAPIVVSFSLGLPAFVAAEAGLAFLGIGLTERPSWGQTILDAIPHFEVYPLFLWAPVIGIMVLVVALNLLGDSLRDAFDPKTRR
ncbi:MAG TPA: ABC transporter permease [Nocardioidaceae bacterium]|nr:ABC transporter permease [Nocardioidaceae bacterium]